MSPEPPGTTRDAALAAFRWIDGHADVWRLFRDPSLLRWLGEALAMPFADEGITAVVGIESRGFILAPLVAQRLDVGFVAVRKDGALFPGEKHTLTAEPDYCGQRPRLSIQRNALEVRDRVLLVDDWIESGSQAATAAGLVRLCGAEFVGMSVVVDQLHSVPSGLGRIERLFRANELPPDDGESPT